MASGLALLAVACGASSPRSQGSQGSQGSWSAAQQLQRARGTTVFGAASEFLPSALPEVGDRGLFAVRSPVECEVSVLAGGEASFAERMRLLSLARRSIRIQALIFTADESGLRVAEVLKQKKAAGLDVRVIVDGLSNSSLQTQWMYFDLKQHGVEVEGYEAIGLQWMNEVPIPLVTPRYDPLLPNLRYHEKLWIVDGGTGDALAITGGLNIANEYFRVDPQNVPRYWRDQDVLTRGPVIDDLTRAFDRNWDDRKQDKAARGGLTDAAWEATRAILDRTGALTIPFSTRAELNVRVAQLEARPPPRTFQPSRCRFFQSRPRLRESYIQQAYLKLLAAAQREVLLANAYFVPTESLSLALREAARRCVRVVVLANSAETNDTPGITLVGRGYYAELLAVNDSPQVKACPNPGAGLELWEWHGKRAGQARATEGLLHAKFAVVDRQVSLVGSHNLDPRSERLNSESALVYENAALAEQLARTFLEEDLAKSRRISAAEAAAFEKPASVYQRFKKELAGMFEEHL
jgi:cardiolipin synthase C